MKNTSVLFLAQASMIAAIYVVLTVIFAPLSFGEIQVRFSEALTILPHKNAMIPTGLSMEIPEGYFGAIYARSGLATKEALRPANCVGVIDADYRGPIVVALHNDGEVPRIVAPGERIAQLVIQPFLETEFTLCDELDETDRGERGFGSTGKQ